MNYCFLTIYSMFNVSTEWLTFCSNEGELGCDEGFPHICFVDFYDGINIAVRQSKAEVSCQRGTP